MSEAKMRERKPPDFATAQSGLRLLRLLFDNVKK